MIDDFEVIEEPPPPPRKSRAPVVNLTSEVMPSDRTAEAGIVGTCAFHPEALEEVMGLGFSLDWLWHNDIRVVARAVIDLRRQRRISDAIRPSVE